MTLDTENVDRAVLALLLLGLHDGIRAWKGFDWESQMISKYAMTIPLIDEFPDLMPSQTELYL